MKLSRIAKVAIALAVTLVTILIVVTYAPTWREITIAFAFIGIVATIVIPIYFYFDMHRSRERGDEQARRMSACVTMLKDLKQELPEYGNEIDFIIDEVGYILHPRIAESYQGKKDTLRENWVKLSKHPKLREKWLKLVAEEYKEWLKAEE